MEKSLDGSGLDVFRAKDAFRGRDGRECIVRPQTTSTGSRGNRYGRLILTGMAVSAGTGKHPAGSTRRSGSILDVLGWRRSCLVVWRASPFPWRLVTFPYGVIVYRRLFAASDTLRYLHAMHAAKYDSSHIFRMLRPRYRRIERLLREFGVADEGEGEKVGT